MKYSKNIYSIFIRYLFDIYSIYIKYLLDIYSSNLIFKHIKLNEAGKQYYKMSCMTLNSNEIDEDWVDISKFIGKYTE